MPVSHQVLSQKNASKVGTAKSNQAWAVACASITFALTFIAVGMHLHPITNPLLVGKKAEGILILVLAAFWTAIVSIVSDASHGLAVDEEGSVENGYVHNSLCFGVAKFGN